MKLSELSIRRPVFATVLSLLLLIVGLVSMSRLSVREYPNIDPVVVSVTTTYRGASAQVVENKITQVIEDRIAGLEGIVKLQSQSADEFSNIRVEFDVSRDLDSAANDVRDRVSRVLASLPQEADPPQVLKADSTAQGILFVSFASDALSLLEITDYAERYVVDRLAAVPGVARVSMIGERRPAMRIWINPQMLAARALTVTDIEDALRKENVQLPAGRLESSQREFSLRTNVGLDSPEDFSNLVIGRGSDGHLVRLGEVADVQLGAQSDRTSSRADGKTSLLLAIEAQSKANILEVARGARAEVERMKADMPPGAELGINYDQAVSVEASLHEVEIGIGFALASVLIVIYFFLGSIRATLIPAVIIPVSIIAAFTVMYFLNYSINVLTLLAIVLAIGLVVDDAIVVLENIHRRMELGEPPLVAAFRGSEEIGFAVIATTLTLVAVFVPISFLPGNAGRLFREFGFTLAASVLLSALVALTLTPMMASRMSGHGERGRVARATDRFFRWLARIYEGLLRAALRRAWFVIAGTIAIVALGAWTFRTVPSEFAPRTDIGFLTIQMLAPEGASFSYTEEYGRRLEEIVTKEAAKGGIVRNMIRIPGGFGNGGAGDVNSAIMFLMLDDWQHRRRATADIQTSIAGAAAELPGVRTFILQMGGLGGGGGRAMQAVIGGPDYEQLAQWTDQLVTLAQANPGLIGVDTDFKERKPQMHVSIDRNRAAELGVSLQTVGRTLETVLGSRIVTTYLDRGREYNVILQGHAEERATPTDLTSMYVRSDRSPALIPLSNLVQLQERSGPVQFNRFERLRAITISADLAPGYTLGEAVQWFQQTVKTELPGAARLMFNGEAREYLASGGQLYIVFLFALAVVFLVLAAQFESFLQPAIIMVSVPLALLGAIFGLKWSGLTINIFSQIAAIMLIGIAAKNGVLIVEFANQLREQGVERIEAIVQAAVTRLRPVLMTSLCTAFGALPLLLATGAGAEQREPVGVVVFYGTTISVFLTILAVPVVYAVLAHSNRSAHETSRVLDKLIGRQA
jgi:multidrug efflux pump